MTVASHPVNSFGRYRRCHIIHLLQSLILIIVFVLVPLLLPPLINGEIVGCRANQSMFVSYASTGTKMALLTELVPR